MFSYIGSDVQEKWKGRVLRISKDVLSLAATSIMTTAPMTTCHSDTLNDEIPIDTNALYYIRDIVKPLLKHYVDVPEVIHLQWEFVAALRNRTLSDGVIPLSRQSHWKRRVTANEERIPAPVAQLLWNYRKLNQSPCISMEIKPKAGYKAVSPLVDPEHRVKFQKTRFEILQQLHCNGYITKGWDGDDGCTKSQPSLYNPLDLFSKEFSNVKRALGHLFETPQNNMRAWIDDTPLGADVKEVDDAFYERVLGVLMTRDGCLSGCSARESFVDSLTTCASHILLQEDLLEKLLRLQRLDVVDADGAILIYERLCELCGGSPDDLLDNASPVCQYPTNDEECILADSPFQRPLDCPALDALLHEFSVFSSKLEKPGQPTHAEMDEALERSKRCVKSLTTEACIFVLKNWLLSLVMCDVSFFLVLHPISLFDDLDGRGVDVKDIETSEGGKAFSISCQTERTPGLLIIHGDGDDTSNSSRAFAYVLKVIDCDRKPANKLRKRKEKEEAIRFYKEN